MASLKSPLPVAGAVSLLVHAALVASLSGERPAKVETTVVELELYEPPPPPPPPPAPVEPEPARAEVDPAPVRPPPVKRAALPPPPNQPPPPEAQSKPVPVKVGISLGSTTTGGGFAVGVGNTTWGKADETAADPAAVRPYAAPAVEKAPYVPPTRLSKLPKLIGRYEPPYTEEARRLSIEGDVVLELTLDERGLVTNVRVIKGLPGGLTEAARSAALAFRFEPALQDGAPVKTRIPFTLKFMLD